MKIVICPDSFKGTLSSFRAASVIRNAALDVFPDAQTVAIPMADGGEGTCAALGARAVPCTVTGPNGTPVGSFYGALGDVAVIELAAAAGLTLADPRDPLVTTSFGVGELILRAADAGFKKFVLALGGSAVNDCGCGMASACGVRFSDGAGREFIPVGGTLGAVRSIDAGGLDERIVNADITVICDVRCPLYGPRGAAYVFAPQKGADERGVIVLDEGLRSIAEIIKKDVGIDVSEIPGGGAAGGCGAGAIAFFGAELRSGANALLDAARFEEKACGADLVVTGEGRFDSQSAEGKATAAVAARAHAIGVPTVVFCGSREEGAEELIEGVAGVYTIGRFPIPNEKIAEYAEQFLFDTAREFFASYFT